MTSWAKPGAKCVCINDAGWSVSYNDNTDARGPSYGETVVIKGIGRDDIEVVVWLVGYDLDYPLSEFRPLVSQADDLALFAHLLDGQPVRETA